MRQDVSASSRRGPVYIVDDDAELSAELSELLANNGYEPYQFGNGSDFLAAMVRDRPTCVLLDVRMPGVDGIAVQARLRSDAPLATVIMLSGYGDISIAVQATKAGAIDFIEKPVTASVVLAAVADALVAAEARRTDLEPVDEARRLVASLSQREYQVLQGMVAGCQNKVIAFELNLSQRTVEIYRAKAMKKLHARSLPIAVQKALSAGVMPLPAGSARSVESCYARVVAALDPLERDQRPHRDIG